MYWELGKNGHITMEFNFNSEEIETSVQPGFRFSGGWAKRFMISNALRQESVAVDSHLLITEKRDIDVESVKGLCAEVQNSGKHLVDFNAKDHANGIYLVNVSIDGNVYTKRIVLAN